MKQLFQKQPFIDDNLNTLFHHLNWTPERSQLLQQSITAAFDASDYWTVDIFDSVYPRLSSCRMLTMGDRDRIRAQPTTHQDKNRELMDQLQSYGSGGFLALLKGILRRPVWNHIVTDILSRFEDQNLAVMIAQGLNFSYISARRPEAQAVRNNRLTQAPAPAPARNRKIAHLCRSFQWNEADHLKLKRAIETGFDTAEMWGADIIGRIAPDLRSSGLLDSSDIQQIKANITSHDKNRALIEVLSTRESGAYLVVLEAIKKQRVYEHAVKTVLNSLAEDDSALAAHIAAAIQLSGYRVPQSTRPPSRSAHQEARRPVVQVIAAGVSHHTNSSEYSHLPSKERIERLRNVLIQWPLELATATLRQNSIIDQNDIQMINVRTTTQNKRDTLLDLILQRERGVDTFLNYCRSHTELGSVVQMINSGRGAQPQTHVSWQQGQVASSSTSSVSSRSPHLQQVRIVQTPHAPLAPLAPLAATAGSGHTQLVQDLLAESTRVSTEVDRSKHEKEQLELQVIELQSRMERLQTQKQPPSYSTGGASIGATGTGQSLSTLTTQGSSLTTQYELESLRAENAELLQWRKQAEESKHRMQYELEKTLECGICLQLKEGSMINSPCGHPFCEDCIQRVVQDDRVECPTCRASNRFDSYRPLKQSMPAGFLTNTRK